MVAKRFGALYRYLMNAGISPHQTARVPLSPSLKRKLRKIERDFHVRAFGEEMARINFLPLKQRKAAVAEMIDHARGKGVNLSRPALGETVDGF